MSKSMLKTSDITKFWTAILQLGIILVALWATSFHSYLLFHTLAEVVSVILAVAIFLVAWNARRFWNNGYYLLIGFGFLFAGVVDLLHTFEYKGVGIMQQGGDVNVATQLWLAGRYIIAISFLAAPLLSNVRLKGGALFGFLHPQRHWCLRPFFIGKYFPWRMSTEAALRCSRYSEV